MRTMWGSEVDTDKLTKLYEAVFEKDGSIKNCGREKCKELIKYMNEVCTFSCGDENTGMMNIPKITKTYHLLLDPIS